MEDKEKNTPNDGGAGQRDPIHPSQAADDEAAAAKVWAVYVSEAERYDKALVENWRANMEGMLIFAGLFSASLTAFLIESYKSLNPDAADITVHLLTQISQQLAAAGNGTTAQMSELPPFSPSIALVVCNSLWFISLGLSLACALTATLLEQWARDFLHRADMRSAPLIRARVFSYLYYGMQRFNMHTVVEVIPLLLHASLVLFFAGLVAFLFPINRTMMIIVAVLMLVILAGYAALTVLPLLYLDCPYRTPLSGTFWRVVQYFKQWLIGHRTTNRDNNTGMVEEMQRRATLPSAERKARDCRALVWTVKSLTDDVELEPFLDALPDLLWIEGSHTEASVRRYSYEDHIRNVVRCDDTALASRIIALLGSCQSGLLPPDISKRRQISAYKAVWAISSLPSLTPFEAINSTRMGFGRFSVKDAEIQRYCVSAEALVNHSLHRRNRSQADSILADCEADITAGKTPNLDPAKCYVQRIAADVTVAYDHGPATTPTELMKAIRIYCAYVPLRIFLRYLAGCASLDRRPYCFSTTKSLIYSGSLHISVFEHELDFSIAVAYLLDLPIDKLDELAPHSDHWIDELVTEFLAFGPDNELNPVISRAIFDVQMKYLGSRTPAGVVRRVVAKSGLVFWSCLPRMLADPIPLNALRYARSLRYYPVDALLTAFWRLCSAGAGRPSERVSVYGSVLEAVSSLAPSSLRTSVLVMVKAATFIDIDNGLPMTGSHLRALYNLRPPVLPAESGVDIPADILAGTGDSDSSVRIYRWEVTSEARIWLLAEFLESCCASELPYKALETLPHLDLPSSWRPSRTVWVHKQHQGRLANSIRSLHDALPERGEILEAVIKLRIFMPYKSGTDIFGVPVESYMPWLDDTDARHSIMQVFGNYRSTLSDDKSALAARLDELAHGFKIRHSAPEDVGSIVVE